MLFTWYTIKQLHRKSSFATEYENITFLTQLLLFISSLSAPLLFFSENYNLHVSADWILGSCRDFFYLWTPLFFFSYHHLLYCFFFLKNYNLHASPDCIFRESSRSLSFPSGSTGTLRTALVCHNDWKYQRKYVGNILRLARVCHNFWKYQGYILRRACAGLCGSVSQYLVKKLHMFQEVNWFWEDLIHFSMRERWPMCQSRSIFGNILKFPILVFFGHP